MVWVNGGGKMTDTKTKHILCLKFFVKQAKFVDVDR